MMMHLVRCNAFLGRPLLSATLSLSKGGGIGSRNTVPRIPNPLHLCSVAEFSEFECDAHQDDAKATEKHIALHSALSQITVTDEFGEESVLSLERFFGSRRAPVISTGSLKLDMALGIGGLPKGRFIEIFGQEASGKTTLALHIVKEAQKLGGYCVYLDAENTMDWSLLESIGVNSENLLIVNPDSGENLLSMVDTLTKSRSVDVIVVDSVAALVPQLEIDEPTIGNFKAVQSVMMNQALRKINHSLAHSGTVIVFLNQTRSYLRSGQDFRRVDEVTCGGNALKFYAAVRLRIVRTGLLKAGDKITGLGIRVEVVKNKLATARGKAELVLRFGKGIRTGPEVFELACEYGIILKQGSNYVIEGRRFDSEVEAQLYLAENDDICGRIVTTLRQKLFPRNVY